MFSEPQQQHEMQLSVTYPSGVEEWYCPQCGRRFLMQWKPVYSKVVLETGDEFAIHSGGRWVTNDQQSQDQENTDPGYVIKEDDPGLEPFVQWMERIDFENFWSQKS